MQTASREAVVDVVRVLIYKRIVVRDEQWGKVDEEDGRGRGEWPGFQRVPAKSAAGRWGCAVSCHLSERGKSCLLRSCFGSQLIRNDSGHSFFRAICRLRAMSA